MMLFSLFCLVAFASALPAPQSSELIAPGDDLHVNAVESSAEKGYEILSPIPPPPELGPLGVMVLEVKKESEEEKKEEVKGPKEEISGIVGSNPEEVVVNVVENKPPSLITSYFPNLSWPTWPLQIPSFNFGNFPFLSNLFGGRQLINTNPNYRYLIV